MGGKASSSKPTHTKQQKMLMEWGEGAIIPLAEGKDTVLTERLEQQARDITDLQRKSSAENIMNVAGRTGMGGSQVAGLMSQAENTAIQAGFKNIMGAKMSLTNKAMDMISGVPLGPGQETKGAKKGPGAAIAAGIGVIAAPFTGGASLALTAAAAGSMA